jgi:hypothetical protein
LGLLHVILLRLPLEILILTDSPAPRDEET